MNYFELINKCLVELNYKQVNAFSELTKNDYKKIKNILNIINNEVCASDNWNFKLRKTTLTLCAKQRELKNTIPGRISSIVIDGVVYKYFDNPEEYLRKNAPSCTYSLFNDKILLPVFEKPKIINIVYYTSNSAISETVDEDGKEIIEEKTFMEKETDKSLLPSVFAEPILVYGTCMRLKANPQHVKFAYWLNMYNNSIANMRSKIAINADSTPSISMRRN